MRNRFVDNLIKYCEKKKNVYLLTGDLGFAVLEPFIEKNPKNFFNMGVAEQNMMGVASGLALEGNKVFTYSISNFATSRCHEQIRNDICYAVSNRQKSVIELAALVDLILNWYFPSANLV